MLLAHPNLCLLKPGFGVLIQFVSLHSRFHPLCSRYADEILSLKGAEPFPTSGPWHILLSVLDPLLSWPVSGTLLLPFRPGPGAASTCVCCQVKGHSAKSSRGREVWSISQSRDDIPSRRKSTCKSSG